MDANRRPPRRTEYGGSFAGKLWKYPGKAGWHFVDVPDGIERGYTSASGWGWCGGSSEYFLEGTAPHANGCGFRLAADDAFEGLRGFRDKFVRMIQERVRDERESLRIRRARPR